jgi:hypothetical protein
VSCPTVRRHNVKLATAQFTRNTALPLLLAWPPDRAPLERPTTPSPSIQLGRTPLEMALHEYRLEARYGVGFRKIKAAVDRELALNWNKFRRPFTRIENTEYRVITQ